MQVWTQENGEGWEVKDTVGVGWFYISCGWSYIWPPAPRGLGLYRVLWMEAWSRRPKPPRSEAQGTYNMPFRKGLRITERQKTVQQRSLDLSVLVIST